MILLYKIIKSIDPKRGKIIFSVGKKTTLNQWPLISSSYIIYYVLLLMPIIVPYKNRLLIIIVKKKMYNV